MLFPLIPAEEHPLRDPGERLQLHLSLRVGLHGVEDVVHALVQDLERLCTVAVKELVKLLVRHAVHEALALNLEIMEV